MTVSLGVIEHDGNHAPKWPFTVNEDSPQARGLLLWWPMVPTIGFDPTRRGGADGVSSDITQAPQELGGMAASGFLAAGSQINVDPFGVNLTTFCVSWWFKAAALADLNYNIRANDAWGTFLHHSAADGRLFVGTDVATRITGAAGTYSNGVLHHCVFSLNAASTGKFYINGKLFAEKTSMTAPGSWSKFLVAVDDDNGLVFDVRIYDRAPSDAEAWAMYNPPTRWDLYQPLSRRLSMATAFVPYPRYALAAGMQTMSGGV